MRSVLALVVVALAADARADVLIRGGPVLIRVGGPPVVVPVQTQSPSVEVQPPPGVPLEIAPPAQPVPLPGSVPVLPTRPLTVREFVCSFQPTCGTHSVVLLHPFTNCPVNVCFTLPSGCGKVKVKRCLRERIVFDFGRKEVEIVFLR
ncbi:MAG: hypothetical protein HYS12_00240, partial [Planctomycetes bacterium]|nr:hypothetical protein [Planctomycetota bacterium]